MILSDAHTGCLISSASRAWRTQFNFPPQHTHYVCQCNKSLWCYCFCSHKIATIQCTTVIFVLSTVANKKSLWILVSVTVLQIASNVISTLPSSSSSQNHLHSLQLNVTTSLTERNARTRTNTKNRYKALSFLRAQ